MTKWEDFEGMKVRVMQNNIFLDTFKTLGAKLGKDMKAVADVIAGYSNEEINALEKAGSLEESSSWAITAASADFPLPLAPKIAQC